MDKSVVIVAMCKECGSFVVIAPDPFDRDYLWQCENNDCCYHTPVSLYDQEEPSWAKLIDR